jgi:hypothetical protein
MGAGTLALACAFLLGQIPGDVIHTNRRDHRFNLTFDPSQRGLISEVRLFASWDPDHKMWQQVASVAPTKDFITFVAPADGYYWLKVAVVNTQKAQVPENIAAGPPDQKLLIDTVKPVIRSLQAKRQGTEVVVSWEIQEEHPDVSSFRLEFQLRDAQAQLWTAITATPGPMGQARFQPGSAQPLIVRLTMRDLAGNQSHQSVEVSGESVTTTGFTGTPGGAGSGQVQGAAGQTGGAPQELQKPIQISGPPSGLGNGPAPLDPPSGVGNTGKASAVGEPSPPGGSTLPSSLPGPLPSPTGVGASAGSPPPLKDDRDVIASSKWNAAPPPPPPPSTTPPQPLPGSSNPETKPPVAPPAGKPLPPLQYINQSEFTVEYEVSRIGPSGIGSVELYRTHDDGRTWEKYAYDDKIGNVAKGTALKRTVQFLEGDADGIYGFTLVIKNRANVGRQPPQPGEAPELRIELDRTLPVAQLYKPTPDSKPGHLLLRWEAGDKNLTPTPICLEWSEQRNGTWQPIGIDLPNNGRYSWQLPEKLPVEVFLRLRVRDLAGNETVAITPNPLAVDLHEPEGHLLRVTVPGRP